MQHRLCTALSGRRLMNTTGLPGRRRVRLALGCDAMAFKAEETKTTTFLLQSPFFRGFRFLTVAAPNSRGSDFLSGTR